jgi:small subunit ribosomal protein S9
VVEAEPAAAEEPAPAEEEPAGEDPAPAETGEAPPAKAPKPRGKRDRRQDEQEEPEVIPGAHLEPDLVLEEPAEERDALTGLAGAEIEAAEQQLGGEGETEAGAEAGESAPEPAPEPMTVLELAADARYRATGKRKRAVARVILKPGTGTYTVNGRELDAFFPRPTLQTIARQPLQAVGQAERMDVVAKIHGGGVSSQAGALRHGIARALVEADPNLRAELKRRGYLTRDARVKERKKAGLKKARKRPQFSKR